MNSIKTIKIQPDVLYQEVRGETVLLNLDKESYFGLDETGTYFWELLQQNSDYQAVFDIMLNEYDVDAIQLKTDLDILVKELLEAGLIEISD